ncbi:hypothetical protein [Limnobacter litoralis]|uniref:Uncharacterized protein n=1 Tax=Limnobacter litoralis TaxID=481366 RepID=A0ABQ5YVY4_9BURK|nr:hypothetical protein [Limnobacter litoralis]GLR26944.1 hypothetical protein GCM10007875_20340 [Limnobacter litoralis]
MKSDKPTGLIALQENAAYSRANRAPEPDLPEGPLRQAAQAIFKQGLLHAKDNSGQNAAMAHGKYIFALAPDSMQSADKTLFLHKAPEGLKTRTDGFTHACFNAGGPVHTAGELWVYKGKPLLANNASGHYRPPALTLRAFTEHLLTNEVDIHSLVYQEQHLENNDGETMPDQYRFAAGSGKTLDPDQIRAVQHLEVQFEKILKMSTEAVCATLQALQLSDRSLTSTPSSST